MPNKTLLLSLLLITINLYAQNSLVKQALLSNSQLLYFPQREDVTNFTDIFQKADVYGRLRNNNFYYIYEDQDNTHQTQLMSGVGGSLLLKSARFYGFDADLAFYYTKSFHSLDDATLFKSGKDTLSRFDYINSGKDDMTVLGQANIGYSYNKTEIRVGRQLVETFYTKSNDTKMIPNTFDGIVARTAELPQTKLTFAYLVKQKLRDHQESHALFMVGDSLSAPNAINPQWSENDDSVMLKGLTYTALLEAGKPTDAPLIIFEGKNRSLKDLSLSFSSYHIPELLSQLMLETNYKINLQGFSLTPGVRYIHQFDHGAGAVGGASLTPLEDGDTSYKDPDSLEADMIAARVVAKFSDYKLNLGYTNILNKADLVTPWRGFPTSGYTRSMGIYNWKANTKSYRIELVKGAKQKGIYKKPYIQTSLLYIDGDSMKSSTAQSLYYYAALIQNLPSLLNFQYKVRLGYRDFIASSSQKSDYLDARFELNYLF